MLRTLTHASQLATDRGRLRAFFRICLNDGSLSEYAGALLANRELVRNYYKRGSILRNGAASDRLVRALLQLEHSGVVFRFREDDPALDAPEAAPGAADQRAPPAPRRASGSERSPGSEPSSSGSSGSSDRSLSESASAAPASVTPAADLRAGHEPPAAARPLLALALQARRQSASEPGPPSFAAFGPPAPPPEDRAYPPEDEDPLEGLPPLPPPAAPPVHVAAPPPEPSFSSSSSASTSSSGASDAASPPPPRSARRLFRDDAPARSAPAPFRRSSFLSSPRAASLPDPPLTIEVPPPVPYVPRPAAAEEPRAGQPSASASASAAPSPRTPPLVERGGALVARLPSPPSSPPSRRASVGFQFPPTAGPGPGPRPDDDGEDSESSSGLSSSSEGDEEEEEEEGAPASARSQESGPMSARSASSGAPSRPATPPFAQLGGRLLQAIVILENYAVDPRRPPPLLLGESPEEQAEAPAAAARGKAEKSTRCPPRWEEGPISLALHEEARSARNGQCPSCSALLRYSTFGGPAGSRPARFCWYYGAHYCDRCSGKDRRAIPAHVVHRWDFAPRPVCFAAAALLERAHSEAPLAACEANPGLHHGARGLAAARELRLQLFSMLDFLRACPRGAALLERAAGERGAHAVERPNEWTMRDLAQAKEGTLAPALAALRDRLAAHVARDCELCRARGFICELCGDPDPVFPFQAGTAFGSRPARSLRVRQDAVCQCPGCFACLHVRCAERREAGAGRRGAALAAGGCPKCLRIRRTRLAREASTQPEARLSR
eukprot:tig00020723_g13433.t1